MGMYSRIAAVAGIALVAAVLPAGSAAAEGRTRLTISIAEQDSKPLAASLRCNPPSGTHPKKADACVEIHSAGGDLDKLPGRQTFAACTKEYRPIVTRAYGLAEGKPVTFERTYPNRCELGVATGSVFELFTGP